MRFSPKPRYVVFHRSYLGSTDDDGYPVGDHHGDAVARKVYDIFPESSRMDQSGMYDRRVVTSLVLAVPDVAPYATRDVVVVPGSGTAEERTYYVSEDVRDFNQGPHNFKPGGEVTIQKVMG